MDVNHICIVHEQHEKTRTVWYMFFELSVILLGRAAARLIAAGCGTSSKKGGQPSAPTNEARLAQVLGCGKHATQPK